MGLSTLGKTQTKLTFKEAVLRTADVATGYKEGLQAIKREHTKLISAKYPRKIEGSVDLDACLKKKYEKDFRWDYAIGYDSLCYFVEVHKAETSEINTIIKKRRALGEWLKSSAPKPNIDTLPKSNPAFIWVATNGVHFLPNASIRRLLASNGIAFPKKILILE
ncbi:MAG: hypothetical protein MJZ86_03915 [Bacteroidales bacterium]|nr:hypothetical protein [Bacteroidales bacterium]